MKWGRVKKVRLGLIGLGYIGKIHLRNCLNLDSAKVMAVSDISTKALSFAKKMGVKGVFRDYKQLLADRNVDAVIICLPNHLHACCAKEAAEAEKDIFLEKPLARNVSEGKEIVSVARKSGVKLMVGYYLRFCSSFRELREKMRSGMLGEVQIAYATHVGPGPFFQRAEGYIPRPVPAWWFKEESTSGGALMDLGCFMINIVRWYFGEVAYIRSYLGYRFNMDVEDHAICIAKLSSGQIAIINVGWFSQESQIKVELQGTVKHASANHTSSNKIITAIQLLTRGTPKFYLPHLWEISHFVHCVRHDLPPSPSGNDALRDLETIALAYKNGIPMK